MKLGLALLVVLAVVGSGCGGGGTKAGGKAAGLRLVMEAPDAPDPDAEYFAREVARRTGGSVRIVEGGPRYTSADPDNELRLIRALESGKVKIAYIPSRAWERAGRGVLTFRALQAPFLVDDYDLLRKITTGSVGADMLASLERMHLVGLGLVPSELRRPLGRRPLVSAAGFRDARMRVVSSPTSVSALRALRVTTVTDLDSGQTADALAAQQIEGVESAMHPIEENNYVASAPYLPTNVVLFAKTETIVMRRDAFDALAPAQRDALRAAAGAAVRHADPAAQERAELGRLCSRVKLVTASQAELASLLNATTPVYARLERDPGTRRAIRAIAALRGGASAPPSALPACKQQMPAAAEAATPFPDGKFVTTVTLADLKHAGLDRAHHPDFPATFTTVLRAGRWRQTWEPRDPNGPAFAAGSLRVHGNQVTFVGEYPRDIVGVRELLRWNYYRGELGLDVLSVGDPIARLVYSAHPWRKAD